MKKNIRVAAEPGNLLGMQIFHILFWQDKKNYYYLAAGWTKILKKLIYKTLK